MRPPTQRAYKTFKHKQEIPYPLFSEVLARIMKLIVIKLIQEALVLEIPYLGKLFIKKVVRTAKIKRVDYAKSVKNPDGTLKTIVHYPLTDSYYRFYWQRKPFNYQHLYNFKPTGGSKSNKKTLSDFIKERPDVANKYQKDETYIYQKIHPDTLVVEAHLTKAQLLAQGFSLTNVATACYHNTKHKNYKWKRTPV